MRVSRESSPANLVSIKYLRLNYATGIRVMVTESLAPNTS